MAGKKISVFITVVSFHLVVLGVVYLSTRSDEPEKEPEKIVNPPKIIKTHPKENGGQPPAVVPKPPVQSDYIIHVVVSGDILGNIAGKYKVSSKAIMELNEIKNANKIVLGQKLKIPRK
jgi:LysM repeat protein